MTIRLPRSLRGGSKDSSTPSTTDKDTTSKGGTGALKSELRGMSFADGEAALKPDGDGAGPLGRAKGLVEGGARGLRSGAGRVGGALKGAGKGALKGAGRVARGGKDAVAGAGQAVKGLGVSAMGAASDLLGPREPEAAPLTPDRQQALELFPDEVALHDRVSAEHAPEVDAWLAEHGSGDAGMAPGDLKGGEKQLSPEQQMFFSLGHARGAVDNAKTSDEMDAAEKSRRILDAPGKTYRDDPFHYDRDEIPKETLDALIALGLTTDEVIAVQLYTGGASYPMNAVLRGELTDDASIKAYLPWALKLDSALAKMPATVRNMQKGLDPKEAHPILDPTKDAGEMLDLTALQVYRADAWKPSFQKEVQSNWAVGATITNASFFSTTTVKGSYPGPVQRNIRLKDKSAAASLIDISSVKHENEVLFRPNTQMKITAIRKVGGPAVQNTKLDRVQNPNADLEAIKARQDMRATSISNFSQYKPEDLVGMQLDVDAVVERGPGGAQEDPKKGAKGPDAGTGMDAKVGQKATEGAKKAGTAQVGALLGRLMSKKKKG